jgi:hypothetical protein
MPNETSLGGLIEALSAKQAERKEAQAIVDALEGQEEELEKQILEKLQEVGVDRVNHAGYTAKRDERIYGNIKDYDALIKYIHRNKYYHLLERRIAVLAFRELLGIKGSVPGVEPVTKVKLSFVKTA